MKDTERQCLTISKQLRAEVQSLADFYGISVNQVIISAVKQMIDGLKEDHGWECVEDVE